MRKLIPLLTAATMAFATLAILPTGAAAQTIPVHWGYGGGYGGGCYAPPPPPPPPWYGRPHCRGHYGGGHAPPPYACAPPPRWGGGVGWYR